jgi:hypothetical protein
MPEQAGTKKSGLSEKSGRKVSRAASLSALCVALVLTASCARTAVEKPADPAHVKEVEAWKAGRLASLTGEGGWLSLAGLHWLKEGENRVGSDPAAEVRLPEGKAPREVGTMRLREGVVTFEIKPGVEIISDGKPVKSLELHSDDGGAKPTVLQLGSLSFNVIKRVGRLGVRVKDRESAARLNFKGLEYFPFGEAWRVPARLERYDPPRSIPILNVLGMQEGTPSPGALVFELGGREYRLDALTEEGEEKLFVIFSDQTSGRETYGAGRYLYVDQPGADNRAVVDFNKAYSPPCAFTPYATCPLPPQQNRLPVRVEAGEKKYAGH